MIARADFGIGALQTSPSITPSIDMADFGRRAMPCPLSSWRAAATCNFTERLSALVSTEAGASAMN